MVHLFLEFCYYFTYSLPPTTLSHYRRISFPNAGNLEAQIRQPKEHSTMMAALNPASLVMQRLPPSVVEIARDETENETFSLLRLPDKSMFETKTFRSIPFTHREQARFPALELKINPLDQSIFWPEFPGSPSQRLRMLCDTDDVEARYTQMIMKQLVHAASIKGFNPKLFVMDSYQSKYQWVLKRGILLKGYLRSFECMGFLFSQFGLYHYQTSYRLSNIRCCSICTCA